MEQIFLFLWPFNKCFELLLSSSLHCPLTEKSTSISLRALLRKVSEVKSFLTPCLNWIFITSLTHRAESFWLFTWHVGTSRVAESLGFWPVMKPPETQLPPEKQGLTLYLAYREQHYNEPRSHTEQCHDFYIVLAKVFSCVPRRAKKVAVSPRGHGKVFSEGASIMRCSARCRFHSFCSSRSKEALLSVIPAPLLSISHFCVYNGLMD